MAIDTATNTVVATIGVGKRPWNMALTPDGRKLYVACGRSGAVSVIDTGIGVASEDLSRLFQPFERLSADGTGVEGTGLGLAICKQLVELMGGGIGVSSTPGQGSRFWLTLPEAVQSVWWAAQHAERGSILVPHLPAYQVRDLLAAVTDEVPTLIGVRPGEKVAECLATEMELASASLIRAVPDGRPLYYSIPAVNPSWEAPPPWPYLADSMAQPYTGALQYTSDTWPWRLGVPELKALVEKEETDALG